MLTGFVPFFEQKIQGLSNDTFPIFQGLLPVQKRALSLRLFQFFHNMSNSIPKVFLWFAPIPLEFYLNYIVSIEIQGLSSTNCNFRGLSRPSIFILKFKDFQGVCEPCANLNLPVYRLYAANHHSF